MTRAARAATRITQLFFLMKEPIGYALRNRLLAVNAQN